MLIEDLFINHSFNEDHFLELRKKKEAIFKEKNDRMAEQSISAGKEKELEINEQITIAPWQEILNYNKEKSVTKAEFHRGLNSVRDIQTLKIYNVGVRNGLRGRGIHNLTVDYIIRQCNVRAKKLNQVRNKLSKRKDE
ncbi:hypothetical protein RhiirA4_457951 [Rhizophagus irregularis]|uniref:Uncharacterized protein n=1 Tax=Rhizophagus irregularis TaxID=588596 RepID=A0A2I1GB43_9GLOM|nr:hypothetical protein RhiirA4_457951 [Rhizophagus irregularis]